MSAEGVIFRRQSSRTEENPRHAGCDHVFALGRLSRQTDRGSHDAAAIYDILDASIVCHIAYVVDGLAFAAPTL